MARRKRAAAKAGQTINKKPVTNSRILRSLRYLNEDAFRPRAKK